MIQSIFLGLIRSYQYFISPLLGPACRFHPSCSVYTFDAIRYNGTVKGLYLGFRRILRCHPFHPGGYDPAPRPAPANYEK